MNTTVETREFSRQVAGLWSETEFEEFKVFLAGYPDAGQLIPGTGGVRKVRWGGTGFGKRGGVRIVYYNKTKTETWLLSIYAKGDRETIPAHELKKVRRMIDGH